MKHNYIKIFALDFKLLYLYLKANELVNIFSLNDCQIYIRFRQTKSMKHLYVTLYYSRFMVIMVKKTLFIIELVCAASTLNLICNVPVPCLCCNPYHLWGSTNTQKSIWYALGLYILYLLISDISKRYSRWFFLLKHRSLNRVLWSLIVYLT